MSIRSTAVVTLTLAVAAALTAAGCASNSADKRAKAHAAADAARSAHDDASFAAGTRRPPTPSTSFALAKILISQGRDRDALYVLQRVLRDCPKFVPAYNELAGVYVRADRVGDARDVISAGLKLAPGDAILWNNLGMCNFLQGHHEQALEDFTRAAERVPSNPQYRANRAAALAMLGRDAEAKREYRSVLDSTTTRHNLEVLAKARKNPVVTSATDDEELLPAPSSTQPAADVR
jgi:Flp pilus assembly protein TadD